MRKKMNKHMGSKAFCEIHNEIACEICEIIELKNKITEQQEELDDYKNVLKQAKKEIRRLKKELYNKSIDSIPKHRLGKTNILGEK
jgi:peptidoglycan hydrolase CwlO-like protein